MSHRTLRVYSDEELEYGRRQVSVLSPAAPTVDVSKLVDESFADPLVRLPDGWQDMSVGEIADWSIVESARLGRVQQPGVEHGNGCPKGDWAGYKPDAPAVRDRTVCECCGSSYGLTVEDGVEDGVWECGDCGWDTVDGTVYGEDVGPDRQAGHGWFGGGRSGKPGMYRNDEMAAGRTVYHEGEPVSPEQQRIDEWEFPASWDRAVVEPPVRMFDRPRLKDVGNAYCVRGRGESVWVCRCDDWYDGSQPPKLLSYEPENIGDSGSECHGWDCGWLLGESPARS